MNEKLTKISLGTKICIVIIGILFIALVTVCYLGFIKDEKKQPQEIVANEAAASIPTSELVTLFYEIDNRVFYAYIEEGDLYYFNGHNVSFATSSNVEKYADLSNITRMETYNLGTGVNPVPFLITEGGQVYYIDYYVDDGIAVELYDGLAGYEVEDILSCSGEMSSVFELLLKDGTTQTVECDNFL